MANTDKAVVVVFMGLCIFAIFWMVQGAGLFYSGLTRRNSALIQLAFSTIVTAVISIQWYTIGFSLALSDDPKASSFIGNLKYFMMEELVVQDEPIKLINAMFAGMFCSVTAALLSGAMAERAKAMPTILFLVLWATFVYDPIAYFTWSVNGWSYKLGTLDYAGGTPVHVTAGFSALAFSKVLGTRINYGILSHRPHNATLVVLGTAFLWIGWLGFSAGSAYTPGMQAVVALLNTQLSAAMGGIAWALMDYRLEKKWSIIGFCSGVVAGLVAATPAAGYIRPGAALLFGLLGGVICNLATQIKFYLRIDDALDVLAVHGIGGVVGNVLTGVFTVNSIYEPDGPVVGRAKQISCQVFASVVSAVFAFYGSWLILLLITHVLKVEIRVQLAEEAVGLDVGEHDEFAYDYVGDREREIEREQDPVVYEEQSLADELENQNEHLREPHLVQEYGTISHPHRSWDAHHGDLGSGSRDGSSSSVEHNELITPNGQEDHQETGGGTKLSPPHFPLLGHQRIQSRASNFEPVVRNKRLEIASPQSQNNNKSTHHT